MKTKRDWDRSTVLLKKHGSNLPEYKQGIVLKKMGIPPYKNKEKIIVVPD